MRSRVSASLLILVTIAGCESSPQDNLPKPSSQSADSHESRQKDANPQAEVGERTRLKMSACSFRLPESVTLLDGKIVKLRPKPGEKAVLLYFWTTYTGSILDDIAVLNSLLRRHNDESLSLLTVNSWDSENEVDAFVSSQKLKIPVGLDKDKRLSQQLQATSVPSLYVIGRNGIASRRRIGPLADVDIEAVVDEVANK